MENQDQDARNSAIERRAHEIYEARGGTHGLDQDDWLQAERELGAPGAEDAANTGNVGPNVPVDGGETGPRSGDVMPDVPSEKADAG